MLANKRAKRNGNVVVEKESTIFLLQTATDDFDLGSQ